MKLFGGGAAPPGAYDRVEITENDGKTRSIDRAAFRALGLDERVRYILGKRVKFFSGAREVPVKDALADG